MSEELKPTQLQIARAMIIYGGSFIQQIGKALECADSDNAERIQAAWPEAWDQYSHFAEQSLRRVEDAKMNDGDSQ